MTNLISFVRCSFEKCLLYEEEASTAARGSGSLAGCLSHPGSIRGGEAKGPGFPLLEHSADPLPHLVPGGEFTAKFLNILILPTRCRTCPEAFPQLCSSSVLSQHFSIYSSVLQSDWHVVIEETKPPPPPGACTYRRAPSNSFFLLFLYGIPTFKEEVGKKKRDLASRFQSSVCIYANNPCLGQQDIESLCAVC